jgi:hypothetical protein
MLNNSVFVESVVKDKRENPFNPDFFSEESAKIKERYDFLKLKVQ